MRVLLAQTDRDSLTIFRTAFEAQDHKVFVAKSGESAIRVAMEERPDVIVTELVLPIVDGWQVLQVLHTYAPLRDVPIIALTSHVQPDGESKAVAAGFAAYLTLPMEPLALIEAVERATTLRHRPAPEPPAATGLSRPQRPPREETG